jgi:hypothetical protein
MPNKNYAYERLIRGNPIIDTRRRPGDRHKPGRKTNSGPIISKWERRSIVAWDGEGANLDDGTHVYNLLANSRGDYIIDYEGLSTEKVFDFFIDKSKTTDINVIFGGSYDVNMILRDIPKTKLLLLWNYGKCYWKSYKIQWAPRKKFSVQKISESGRLGKSFVLWDVIGYFQSSFVVACKRWLGDLDVLDSIEDMKLKRSSFKSEDIDSIIDYNKKECELLVMLTEHLFASLDEAEVTLLRYDGAGSIAAALLKKYNVREYMGDISKAIYIQAQHAYSGGRIEAVKIGNTSKKTKVYRYDINSAYPSACMELPSYVGAKWSKSDKWDGSNNSLACVEFHFKTEEPFYPLWYRDSGGNISYPRNGKGIYWGPEIRLLYDYYDEGVDFDIQWAVNCTISPDQHDVKPFWFIEHLYELRKKFKSIGSMASESLKLGLNSLYGKLVQQAGYREGRIPTYHHLVWGGQITSLTRAKLFRAAKQNPKEVISFATDAVFTTAKLDLPCGKELGQWTYDEFDGITIVQAGIYFLKEQDSEEWYEKFRGFDKGSLRREDIVNCWKEDKPYNATLTRFVGLGSALMAKDFNEWRTWRTDNRSLDLQPIGKRMKGEKTTYYNNLCTTKPTPNITPDIISKKYEVIWVDGIKNDAPLDNVFNEDEDGNL